MRKLQIILTALMLMLSCIPGRSQTATLLHEDSESHEQTMTLFHGSGSLSNAIAAASASGDKIVLSQGTFSNPGEIKKSVSIYGQGHEGIATRSYIQGKLQFRSTGAGSLDNIHLEGLYLESHFNLLNDNERNAINNLTVVKCHVNGFFMYMNSDNIKFQNCVIQSDFRCYSGTFVVTNLLLENCWKDGGIFAYFADGTDITIRNSIIRNCQTIHAAKYENSVVENCYFNGGSLTNCAITNTSVSGIPTTNCWIGLNPITDIFVNVSSLAYSEGIVPEVRSEYLGTDGTLIGITGGHSPWSVVPTQPVIPYETTLVKDADGFYQVGSLADWQELKRVVEHFEPDVKVKMTADIDLGNDQTMIGNGDYNTAANRRAFMGVFDGQGHTLTIHYDTSQMESKTYLGCAPFNYIFGATIRNLHTAGTITATQEGVAGLAGWTDYECLIEKCHSSVDITYTNNRYGAGGLTYNSYNNSHLLTIRDCLYDGTITSGTNQRSHAGFVVYKGYGTVNISNSLQNGTFVTETNDCATFIRNPNGTISNSYYKNSLGLIQGTATTGTELATGKVAFYLQSNRDELVWGQEIGVDPSPVLTNDASKRVYRSATGYTNNPSEAIADQGLIPLVYTINADGTLTITGFDPGFTPPTDYILVIPDEIDGMAVTAIGASAFFQKSNFTSLHIGKNVKTIGDEAFRQCKTMASVTFAEDCIVESFGNSAFRGCDALTSFTMPNTVTTIGELCFQANPLLSDVTLSSQLRALPLQAFYTCPSLDNVVIPSTVTSIGNYAFYGCTSLSNIIIPNTVTGMGTNVFYGCSSLTTATFEEGCTLTTLPQNTFYGCTSLSNFTIPSSVQTIGAGGFENCTSLSSIALHSQITTIQDGAFRRSGLQSVVIPSTVTSMGAESFRGSALTSADISCATIGKTAFMECTALEEVSLGNTVVTLGENAFRGCSALPDITIPSSVTTMNNYTFYQCGSLESCTFEDGINLATIPAACFYECRALKSIDIPSSVTLIDDEAFRRCSAMTAVNFPSDTHLTTIDPQAFRGCESLTSIHIPESVTSIGESAFTASLELEEVILPSTLKKISTNTFNNTKLSSNFCIPSTVETIEGSAFANTKSLTTITIPNSVKTMGTDVFNGSTALAEVIFEETCQLAEIPNNTFRATALTSIDIPSSVKTIGSNAFYECKQLESVAFPESLTSIGNSAFRYCDKLNNVVLPGSLTTILDWSFANCPAMENLTIDEGVTSINRDVFQYSGMKNVVLPSTIGLIGINLFYQCNQLQTLDVSKCVNVWELYNYTSLRGTNTIFYGVPTSTKIILPPYAGATLGANDEVATLTFDLEADNDGFYLINNAADWDKFVVYSRIHPSLNGRITADIDLTGHEGKLGVGNGDSNHITYKGTLDGMGHTLKIKYRSTKDFNGGLLAYVEDATVKDLRVDGFIDVRNRHIGGFVGYVINSLTMEDCESSVDFFITPTTTNMHVAGFIGQGKQGRISFTDCLFNGTIDGGSNICYGAAFLGWMESAGRVTYNNCLSNGSYNLNNSYTYALGATQSNGQSTVTACYYRSDNIVNKENLAIAASESELASGKVTFRLQGGRDEQHWGQLLGTDPAPRLTNNDGTLVYRGDTYTNEYVENSGMQQDEDGYYLLKSVLDWVDFAELVEEGVYNAKAKMTADIDLGDSQARIGSTNESPAYYFKGEFDGQGHTLTVHYTPDGAKCIAPFPSIAEATIRNLHIDGTMVNSGGYQPAPFGRIGTGTSTIENIWSSVVITNTGTSWRECSGLVGCVDGYVGGHLIMSDCIFTGSVTSNGSYDGCLIGYINSGGSATVSNCVSLGSFYYSGSSPGIRGNYGNCYIRQFASSIPSGMQTNYDEMANGTLATKLQAGREESVWVQDVFEEIPMLKIFANQYKYTVPSSGIGTFSAAGAVSLPEGLTGHYCTTLTNEGEGYAIVVNEITGDIPASTGVLLCGEPGETYILTASDNEPEALTDNSLVAVVHSTHIASTEGDYTNYMLKSGNFIRIKESGESSKMSAHKAYLQIPNSAFENEVAERLTVIWDSSTLPTSIQGTSNADIIGQGAVYDVQGRKVGDTSEKRLEEMHLKAGVYIVNGKKIMVK